MKKVKYSFKDWCLDNNHQDWLALWDYDLNDCNPEDVTYKSSKKYYFKCPRKLHKSEIKSIVKITVRNNLKCNQCNSFAQLCLDNNHQDYLNLWDYELNKNNPWEISHGSSKQYYFKCPNNLHPSHQRTLNGITSFQKDANGNLYMENIECFSCRSFAQWCLDNNQKELLDSWDYNKNNKSPWEVFAKTNKKYYLKCPSCGFEKLVRLSKITERGFSCSQCGDSISYPNKFMYSLLNQLKVDYVLEYSPLWSNKKRYDIYIPSLNCIVENHGRQHYEYSGFIKRKLIEEQTNDEYKKQLAMDNGIDKYIVVNCSQSEMNYIKNSIMQSDLPSLLRFDECDVDWKLCAEVAKNSMVKQACDMWNNGVSIKNIAIQLKVSTLTINRYLKQGTDCGICNYCPRKYKTK